MYYIYYNTFNPYLLAIIGNPIFAAMTFVLWVIFYEIRDKEILIYWKKDYYSFK